MSRAANNSVALLQGFTTRGVTATDKVELWERHNAEALVSLECRSLNSDEFEATEINVTLPRLNMAKVGAGSHVIERNQSHINSSEQDLVALYFALEGDSFFYTSDGVYMQKPGSLLVCDAQKPFMRGFAKGLKELVLTVPHVLLQEISGLEAPDKPTIYNFSDVGKKTIENNDATALELARLVHSTLKSPENDEIQVLEDEVINLLRDLFVPEAEHTAASYRRAAVAWIRHRIRDPQLSVASVAAGIGLSERHLARIFQETGAGVAKTILEMRLGLAHRVLENPGAPPVIEVALSCGFVSAAHFSRVYSSHYGYSPSQTPRKFA